MASLNALDGFVVGITADRRWEEQADLLVRRGAAVVHGATMATTFAAADDRLEAATREVIARPPDYLVATTGIGMRAWLEAAAKWGLDDQLVAALRHSRIVARGPKAAAAMQVGGLEFWRKSPNEQMASVVDLLVEAGLSGTRVALQEYGVDSPAVVVGLEHAGADVLTVPVYRWRLPDVPGPARHLVELACSGEVDSVTFTSAPAVHNLFVIAGDRSEELRAAFNGEVVAACVGPVCAGGAREEGIEAPLTPPVGRLGLMVRALGDQLSARQTSYSLAGHAVTMQGRAVQVDQGEVAHLTSEERATWAELVRSPGAVVAAGASIGSLRRHLGPAGAALTEVTGGGYRLDL